MIKTLKIKVSGKVQGVYFRASTKEIADQLGIVGFVENLPEGAVYIEAQGEELALSKLVEWCHRGPTRAEVAAVDVEETEPGAYRSFEVQRRWF